MCVCVWCTYIHIYIHTHRWHTAHPKEHVLAAHGPQKVFKRLDLHLPVAEPDEVVQVPQ